MNLKPLGDRLIVQAIEEDETTAQRDSPPGNGHGPRPRGL